MSKKYGLIGHPVDHSLSPQLHSYFASQMNGYQFDSIDVADPGDLEKVLRNPKYSGFNVTSPHKRNVIPYLDELTDEAATLQAVNTIRRTEDGKLIGYNTDVYGFKKLAGEERIRGRKVLIFGTGGAASAVFEAVRQLGAADIRMVSRKEKDDPNCCTYANLRPYMDAEVLINATPIGMAPHIGESPLDPYGIRFEDFPNLKCALDCIYNPYRTKFLFDAEEAGAEVRSGLVMLVYQGLRAAQIWGEVPKSGMVRREFRTRGKGRVVRRQVDLAKTALRRLEDRQLNIVIIGMPGSGKSCTSRQLALRMRWPFIDVDRLIQKEQGVSAGDIIRSQGEDAFRRIETDTLGRVCSGTGRVIATGGGIVEREENFRIMRQNGIVVYIRRPLNCLTSKDRPISQRDGVAALYQRRKSKYEAAADLIIDNNYWFGSGGTGHSKNKKNTAANKNTYMEDIRNFAGMMQHKITKYQKRRRRNEEIEANRKH